MRPAAILLAFLAASIPAAARGDVIYSTIGPGITADVGASSS